MLSSSRWREWIYFVLKIMSLYVFEHLVEWETFAWNGCLCSQTSLLKGRVVDDLTNGHQIQYAFHTLSESGE